MSSNASNQPTFASFYDFYDGPEYREKQLRMYCELASEVGGPVLELACGTGIISIELARAGFHITGLDISPEMLQVAREKVTREDTEVQSRFRLVEGDMKDLHLDEEFSLVLIPSNCLRYLTACNDQKDCLQAVHNHLKPGGLLVIEERNCTPDYLMTLRQRQRAITAQMSRVNPTTGRYTTFNWVDTHVDFATQTIHGRRFIDEVQDDGTVRRYMPEKGGAWQMHYFGRFELQLLIEQAGFAIRDLWGGHARGPFGAQSYNMIFVATRATS